MKNPPKPKKIQKKLVNHGDERIDNYYWLRDDKRRNKSILNYLKQENKYTDQWFKENKVNSKSVMLLDDFALIIIISSNSYFLENSKILL